MATFQQDAGDVRFPFRNFNVPGPDASDAQLIKTLGDVGLEAVQGKIERDLVGPEQPEQVAAVEDAPIAAQQPTGADLVREALEDPELNLRKIARAREQGLVSSTQAKTMANIAVQQASARLPGKAAEFRSKASAFFGDFGEGQGLLQETPDEAFRRSLQQSIMLAAAKAGYHPHEIDEFMDIQRQLTNLGLDKARTQARIDQGKATMDTVLDNAIAAAGEGLVQFQSEVNAELRENNGLIRKPHEFAERLAGLESAISLAVGTSLKAGIVPPGQRSAANKAVADYFTPVRKFVESGDMHRILADAAADVKNFIQLDVGRNFYLLALTHAAGGESGVRFLLDTIGKVKKMTPEAREQYFDLNPARKLIYDNAMIVNDLAIGRQNMFRNILPELGSWARATTMDAAAWEATRGSPNDTGVADPAALSTHERASNEGQIDAIRTYTLPSSKARLSPADRNRLFNWVNTNLAGIEDIGSQALLDNPDWTIRFENGRYRASFTGKKPTTRFRGRRVPGASLPIELRSLVNDLNMQLDVLRNFGDVPEYANSVFKGQVPDEVVNDTFERVMDARRFKEKKEREEIVEKFREANALIKQLKSPKATKGDIKRIRSRLRALFLPGEVVEVPVGGGRTIKYRFDGVESFVRVPIQ